MVRFLLSISQSHHDVSGSLRVLTDALDSSISWCCDFVSDEFMFCKKESSAIWWHVQACLTVQCLTPVRKKQALQDTSSFRQRNKNKKVVLQHLS